MSHHSFLCISPYLTQFSVTLTAPEGVCVFHGVQRGRGGSPHENKGKIESRSVALVKFYIMALEAGTHTLKFTLKTTQGTDILIKTLRVVVRADKHIEL